MNFSQSTDWLFWVQIYGMKVNALIRGGLNDTD